MLRTSKSISAHTMFTSDAIQARKAPITAFKSFMLPEDATELQKSTLEDAYLKLAHFATSNASSPGHACGWSELHLPFDLHIG